MVTEKKSSGCLPVAISCGVVAAVAVSVMAAALVVGIFSARDTASNWRPSLTGSGGEDEFPKLQRTWSYGSGETTVVRIPINGVLTRTASSGMFGGLSDPVANVLTCIQEATKDENVMAIILEIDSPGGEVTASDVIYKALLDFKKEKKGRKVVALFGDVAASGALYLAMAADYIIVQPTTITGSIGVLISTLNFKGLGDKLGVKDMTVKSGKNKDMLNPLREPTPEELALIQAVVDDIYMRFVGIVSEGRHLPVEQVKAMADGRILTARQALDAKLADEEGYWDDAVKKTAELLGKSSVKVFRYEQRVTLMSLLTGSAEGKSGVGLGALLEPKSPRLMYLWDP